MSKKGQIVEIPANSPIYNNEKSFENKEEKFLDEIEKRKYSLFDGFIVGEHNNINDYKLGQRKGINIGGKLNPLYVIGIDKNENRLFVGQGNKHPGLYTNLLEFSKYKVNLTENNFTHPIKSSIKSSIIDSEIFAELYIYNETIYLELSDYVHIDIINHPIHLLIDNKTKTIIK
ncbi:tRNA methyl transferase PRC-barrel domain-containing protein [Chishuiella sp.]|uniref:tRNA methyl transferase PRC-barrel domain-containing protein n=1 Tax=Chishuiella sp. TaxID=1969467 RepID=UPI0028A9143B|nr:tRNA methyl transferase PRC-barrel domain-containing protein [Chishuiella sp.]